MDWIQESSEAPVMLVLPYQALKLVQSPVENPNLACYALGLLSFEA